MPDATNPAARAFALMRLRQLVRSGLLAAMPSEMTDPAAVWRGLSQGLGTDPSRLAQFQAGATAAPHDPSPMAHGGPAAAAPAPADVHHMLAGATPRVQLEALARAKAVAQTMNHLRKLRPYAGRH